MKKILVNLKDWFDYCENVEYAEQVEGLEITVFPSLPYLYVYKDYNVRIGSQKISSFEEGAHTGSISAAHLKDFGVKSVILNHRECQIDDVDKICSKIANAQKYSIEVILCIGSLEERELSKIKSVLEKVGTTKIFIAYEPIEKIELDEIKLNLDYIKKELSNYRTSYIYGGNITVENIEQYDRKLEVDGYLISSHALDVENLKTMISLLSKEEEIH